MATEPDQFHQIWLNTVGRNRPPTDADIEAILEYRESDATVSNLIGELACRGLLRPAQCERLMDTLPDRIPDEHGYNQVLALVILRDSLRTPLSRLSELLDMTCDWAALLAIEELGPYNCGRAFEIVNYSERPPHVKSNLCAAIAAHQKALWADIKPL